MADDVSVSEVAFESSDGLPYVVADRCWVISGSLVLVERQSAGRARVVGTDGPHGPSDGYASSVISVRGPLRALGICRDWRALRFARRRHRANLVWEPLPLSREGLRRAGRVSRR